MPFSQDTVDKLLEKLRARYRAKYPTERLILCVDQRPGSAFDFHVVAVDRSSLWHDFLPAEQVIEILAPVSADERPHE